MSSARRPVPFAGAVAFFRRHPILFFLCLTPGIPEYLSGSSPVAYLVLSPVLFLIFLALNLGLYGPGVLLVREAFVRWKPGWGGLVLLGAGYGILEEGTALSTLYDPHAQVVSNLGVYGHFAGVNWVWAVGIIGVHTVLSVALPILLFGLALPEWRGRSLLNGRQIRLAAVVYAIDIVLLMLIVNYWRQAPGWILAGTIVALLLFAAARALPRGTLDPTSPRPRLSAKWFFLFGLAYFPILLLVPNLAARAGWWPPATIVLDVLLGGGLFLLVRREVGRAHHEAALTMLALGVLVPIMLFGLFAQIVLPLVLVLDVIVGLFFFTLWRRYGPEDAVPVHVAPPVGAT
jgi:hypothetical protein